MSILVTLILQHANVSQITLAKDANKEDLEKAKQQVKDQGGKIVHEFTLIKGFTYIFALSPVACSDANTKGSAEIPDDCVSTLESNDKITVEKDSEVKTQ